MLPLAIILIVPLAVMAALVGVFLCGMDNNVLAPIGLIVPIGLAAKNAILIVEFARLTEEERKLEDWSLMLQSRPAIFGHVLSL